MTLREILQQWLDDATSESPSDSVRSYGLCSYIDARTWSDESPYYEFCNLLREQFEEATFPFGGWELYMAERTEMTQHLNPLRLAWVRKYLEETK